MWKATLKGLLAHKLRLVLTLAIVLASCSCPAPSSSPTRCTTPSPPLQGVYQHVDFEVRGKAVFSGPAGTAVRNPIPQSSPDRRPRAGRRGRCGLGPGLCPARGPERQGGEHVGAPTIALSFNPVAQMSALHISSGSAPTTSKDVVIDAATATKYHFHIGQQVRVLLTGPPRRSPCRASCVSGR